MRIELLATGDEVVSGQIQDTNGPWLMDRLFGLGESVARNTSVGDDLPEIVAALREAAARAELVVVSGGLGPTLDNLTVDAVCQAFGRDPVVDAEQLERIRAMFALIRRRLTPNNERQARVPSGALVLGNDWGTATAFAVTAGPCTLFFLPGVPREFKPLVEARVLPHVAGKLAAAGVFRCYRAVKCYDIPESHMDEKVRELLPAHPHVRYGTRTSYPENQVKLLAEGASEAEALARCEALEREVRAALGTAAYGGADDTFAGVTVAALKGRGWKVAFAESMTAGAASSMMAEVPGASDVLLGSAVTYAESLKRAWLHVPAEVLERDGVVSAACASAMAEGVLASSGADVAASITGWAGPGPGPDGKLQGTVFAAIAGAGPTVVVERRLPFGRAENRRAASYMALDLMRRRALGTEKA